MINFGAVWYQIKRILYYRQTSNLSGTLIGNILVDHSDVDGASPVGAAPTTSSFLTKHLASMDWAKQLHNETKNI